MANHIYICYLGDIYFCVYLSWNSQNAEHGTYCSPNNRSQIKPRLGTGENAIVKVSLFSHTLSRERFIIIIAYIYKPM